MRLIDADELIKRLVHSQMGACMADDESTAKTLQLVIDDVLKLPTVNPLQEVYNNLQKELSEVISNQSIDDLYHGDELDGLNRAFRVLGKVMKKYE